MAASPKTLARALAVVEVGLIFTCIIMLKVAQNYRVENDAYATLLVLAIFVIIPITLLLLCETARYFLRKEYEND